MDRWRVDARAHALAEAPREACGLVVDVDGRWIYHACGNEHSEPEHAFRISAADYVAAADRGKVVAVVHSHPQGEGASEADVAGCRESRVIWMLLIDIEADVWLVLHP